MTSRLADLLVRIEAGKSFGATVRPAADDEWGIVKVSAMTWGEFRPDENKVVTDTSRIDPRHEIRSQDVLVSRANTTEHVGASVLVRHTRPKLLLSDKSLRLVPRSDVDPAYLHAIMSAPQIRKRISALATGTKDSMRNISQSALLQLEVPPLPSLVEQRRTVELLDDHLSRLDAGGAYLAAAARRADSLKWRAAGAAVARVGGTEVSLGDIASVRNGIFVSRAGTQPNGVPILRIGAIRPLSLDLGDLRYSERTESDLQHLDGLLLPGDLLFTRYNGNPRFVGACAVVPADAPALTYPDKLIRVRLIAAEALPAFVALACSVGEARKAIQAAVRTTAGQAGISGRDLKAVQLRLPDRDSQMTAVAAANESGVAAARLGSEIEKLRRRGAALRRSLLADAFSGRLTSASADLSHGKEMINA